MEQKLTKKQYLALASLLFGLFFGAGNLIFPIHLGQISGDNWFPAAIGFLLSSIILPLMSILALSMTRSNSMYDLARPVGKNFASFFLILTHASLGLLVASPRTATVTYSIGVEPFIPKSYSHLGLFIFSLLFFIEAYCLSFNQDKLTHYVGRILNPLFIILLALIFAIAFLVHGDLNGLTFFTNNDQNSSNLVNGFLEGYNTMDALAGLGFGVTIIAALDKFGITNTKERSKSVAKVSFLSMGFESIIYILLIALGAASLKFLSVTDNGGTAFSQIMKHYTGLAGTSILAALTLLACLTTAIGLITSLAQDLGHRFPNLGYHFFLTATTIGAFLIANFGLDQIILYSTPILLFLYPLAIAIIILGLLKPFIGNHTITHKITVYLTMIPAILDLIHNLPPVFANLSIFKQIDQLAKIIPLYDIGLDFIPFTLFGLIIGFIIQKSMSLN